MSEPSLDDAAMRRDIRRVVGLLGDTLARQEGQEVLDLVERVRSGQPGGPRRHRGPAGQPGRRTATNELVRAFVAYFHLANVTEQVHRGRALRRITAARAAGWPARSTPAESGLTAAEMAELAGRVSVRPVFTAHPTEAARPTTLTHLRADCRMLDATPDRGAGRAALAEAVELLWLTDDLRVARPRPPRRGPQRPLLLR